MSRIRRIDAWLGKRVFHPPIIWVCQRAGINQFAFYRYGWWIVIIHAIWRDDHHWAGATAVLVLAGAARTLSAGIDPSRPAIGSLFLRIFFLLALTLDLVLLLLAQALWQVTGEDILVLLAEYATTIRTIPPREVKEWKRARQEAWA